MKKVMDSAPTSQLTAKCQATIPKHVREHLGIGPGDSVKFFIGPSGRVAIVPVIPVQRLKGIVKLKQKKPVSVEEMERAVGDAVVARFERAHGRR